MNGRRATAASMVSGVMPEKVKMVALRASILPSPF
jgi:hypothetical protein